MSETTSDGRRRHECGLCGRHQTVDRLVYSRWTGRRYCAFDVKACRARADRRRNLAVSA